LIRIGPRECRRGTSGAHCGCGAQSPAGPYLGLDPFVGLGIWSLGGVDLMWYRVGADLVVILHLLFIGFIVGGVFLTWRWAVILWAHIPAVIYGALVEFAGFTCPLTLLENHLRQRAGRAGYRDGFIAHYLVNVIYPPGLTHGMQIGLGVLLLVVAIIGYSGFLHRHRRDGTWREPWPMSPARKHGHAQRHQWAMRP
jgi:hypothetical protein